ncbi:MAG: putative metal-binding motif-containing protein [Polyangiaceae bacterium]
MRESDDGLPPPGDGACRQTGTFICNGPTATKCSVTKANCTTLPGGCTELCDGIDNDCDGSVDEPNNAPGANSAFSYKPKVTKIAASTWVMSYEASRPSATATAPGSGNGYWTSAPSGTTLDKTPACSETGKIPWFNVTGTEVEQTCAAMGGVACSTATWQIACNATVPCKWGYSPRGAACTSVAVLSPPATAKFCNLGTTFDFDSGTTGDQDGLLPTHSPLLKSCSDDWSGQFGNTSANDQIWDMTGNLREIVKQANNSYKLMGGAFNTQSEDGAQCSFTFYSVDQNFKFFDTGFRCCFNTDPTL